MWCVGVVCGCGVKKQTTTHNRSLAYYKSLFNEVKLLCYQDLEVETSTILKLSHTSVEYWTPAE